MKFKDSTNVLEDNHHKRCKDNKKKEEISDTERSLNTMCKISNQNKMNTVSSSHSIDENHHQNNHPSSIQSEEATRKNDYSFNQQTKSGDFTPKYTFGRPKPSLKESLNEKASPTQMSSLQNQKISFKISWTPINQYFCCCLIGHVGISKNNCHHFVADVLNAFKYKNKSNYSAFWVWKQTFFYAKYRNLSGCLRTYFTPLILILIGFLFLIFFLIDHFLKLGLVF